MSGNGLSGDRSDPFPRDPDVDDTTDVGSRRPFRDERSAGFTFRGSSLLQQDRCPKGDFPGPESRSDHRRGTPVPRVSPDYCGSRHTGSASVPRRAVGEIGGLKVCVSSQLSKS